MADVNSIYRPQSGLGSVGAYMVSGHPFITGSGAGPAGNGVGMGAGVEDQIKFPYVTQKVTVIASGSSEIRVSFASQATAAVNTGRHYVSLSTDGAIDGITFEVKCKEIFIKNMSGAKAGYTVIAELTPIPTGNMYNLSGDGIDHPAATT
jgi:hypothetical protein